MTKDILFPLVLRFLVPHGHRCTLSHCSRCDHGHQHHSVSLSRNTSTSRESVHSAHTNENMSASASAGIFNPSVSITSQKDPTIRRQHSQPESSCLYCHAHRWVSKLSFIIIIYKCHAKYCILCAQINCIQILLYCKVKFLLYQSTLALIVLM